MADRRPAPPPGMRGPATILGPTAVGIERDGDPRRFWDDLYHRLLAAQWRWLLLTVLGIYLALNALFATLYLLGGDCLENARPGSVTDAFFFSVQTGSIPILDVHGHVMVGFSAEAIDRALADG